MDVESLIVKIEGIEIDLSTCGIAAIIQHKDHPIVRAYLTGYRNCFTETGLPLDVTPVYQAKHSCG